ncbi:MAG TPA: hypothetical protein VGB43_03540 [Flavobacterium sp.]
MRIYYIIIFVAAWCLSACKSTTKVARTASHHETSSGENFKLIRNKKETPEMFPQNFDFSRRFTIKEINILKLDTTQLGPNDYYFLSEDPFLLKDVDNLQFQIYFTHKYGDELSKILRIKKPHSFEDVLLARNGGDSENYELWTEFVNDSIFVETELYMETAKDETSVVSYKYDSIVKNFSYDREFRFKQTSKNTFRFTDEYKLFGKEWKKQHRVISGTPFKLNDRIVSWEFKVKYSYDEKGKQSLTVDFGKALIDTISKKIILQSVVENVDKRNLDYAERNENFLDVDFDGNLDYTSLDNASSGSAGAFTNIYIYNSSKGEYEFSETFSGYNLTVDHKNRTITTTSKSGYGNYFVKVIHLGKKSEILYLESCQSKYHSNEQKAELNYQKSQNGKVLSRKAKTVDLTSIQPEDVFDLLMEMSR